MASAGARQPRLMVITTAPETIGTFFCRQLAFLAREGFEVHAVSAPGDGLDKLAGLPGVAIHPLAMRRRPHPLRDLLSLAALIALMVRLRPGIVHAHTPKAGLLAMMAATIVRVPVRFYTIHGLPLITRDGWGRRMLEGTERLACRLATRVFCVSPSVGSIVKEMRLCNPGRISTPGYGSCAGVDLDRFNPEGKEQARLGVRETFGVPAEATLVCFVGRLAKDKGIAVLSEAWKQVAPDFPEARLMMCGGDDLTDPVPPAALDALRADPRVHMTGHWMTDMPSIYAAADVLVLPTFREGLPQVALEAGAMRLPIVGTRIPGLVNAVDDGATALLVPPGDGVALAGALRSVIGDKERRRRMGEAGREFVAARFSESYVNRLYLGEYRRWLAPEGWTASTRPAGGRA